MFTEKDIDSDVLNLIQNATSGREKLKILGILHIPKK